MEKFNVATLMSEAERVTGLQDWGGTEFLEPFNILIDSINEQDQLTAEGWHRSLLHLENLLMYRLRVFDDRKKRPEIAQQVISAPIFLTGLPRSGTSYLNALLACDSKHLAPIHWQMWCPSPPPNDPGVDHREQIERGHFLIEAQGFQSADIREKHSYGAMHAEEDSHIDEYSFLAGPFTAWWDAPAYTEYVFSAESTPTYTMHKKILQALQVGTRDRRWILKTPGHIMHLDALLSVYPDARFVINHRDPTKVLASGMSLMAAHRRQFGNRPLQQDRPYSLAFMEAFASGLDRLMEIRRDPVMDRRFVDVSYLDLERAPMERVEAVYRHLGEELSAHARAAMQRHIGENRKGKFGKHVYRLSDFNLTQAEVHDRFGNYIRHFNIPLEGGMS